MSTHPACNPWMILRRWAAPAALSLGVWYANPAHAQAPEVIPAPAVAPSNTPADLSDLRALALARQPALEAYRASVRAAELGKQGLDELKVPTVVRPDLPIRRQQSAQGIVAARAQVDKIEWEHRYAVTRLYLTTLYAQEQLKLVDGALDKTRENSLIFFKEVVEGINKTESRRDVKSYDVIQFDVLIATAQARREEGVSGRSRALAALREAVGLDPTVCITVSPTATMPDITATVPCKEEIVRLALERRAEIIQASVAVQVTCLEVKAQDAMRGPRVDTFASGSDIHAIPIPLANFGTEYRPGAVGLEMPSQLVGPREERVARAQALHERAQGVAEKARQLIALEAEDAWHKWNEASKQVGFYALAVQKALIVSEQVSKAFNPEDKMGGRPNVEDVVKVRSSYLDLRLKQNQAKFDLLVALAALERVTAGGFCAGFEK